MKLNLKTRLISAALTCAMLLTSPIGALKAAADDANTGKYVSDVFIAYGRTEDEAKGWLTSHGWEPVNGDLNDGKNSSHDQPIAVVIGIRRTNDANEAVTDMAVMNMAGGYSFTDYEGLLNDKKAQIDEMIFQFLPAVQEFRDNYNGKGSAVGKARADIAYEIEYLL